MELDYQEIGRNVRNYRMKKGLNQRELAELVNVSDQHISHIENAHTKLGLPTLVAIANALETEKQIVTLYLVPPWSAAEKQSCTKSSYLKLSR